ncbi:hypothetical protein G3I59_03745 [Amycolatopsis rubida]|nr:MULTISPECIES: hypothetical protein [Amycolatopsis]MYW89757.1 hypothetical protein [Amycolatopsis rubida]NEC54733.1 hypothetical protein [Amycolatopsis rubida]
MEFPAVARTVLAPVALLAALTACSGSPAPAPAASSSSAAPVEERVPDRQPHTLVLNATGSGSLKQITYTLDGATQETGPVKMPWRQSLTVPADGKPHQWTLEITYSGASGEVDMYSVVDGKESVHTASGGHGNVTGSASIGGSLEG